MPSIVRKETVTQVTFMPRLFPVNCYLIEEEDGFTLIDAALPISVKPILQAAERLGKPIARIVLTHAHDDHVGALDGLKQAMPHIPVYISERDARLMSHDVSLEDGEPSRPIRGGVPKRLKTKADVLLKDGDRIGSLLAVHAPGHTPGSMAFLDIRNRSLIAGDAFQTRGATAVAGVVVPWFPFPAWATWDKGLALESARRLTELRPTLLAAGHGYLIEQPEALMRQAIAQAEAKLINYQ